MQILIERNESIVVGVDFGEESPQEVIFYSRNLHEVERVSEQDDELVSVDLFFSRRMVCQELADSQVADMLHKVRAEVRKIDLAILSQLEDIE